MFSPHRPALTHFAVISPPYAGHLNPMLALSAGLVGRGHNVTVFGQADMAALLARPGVGFVAVGAATHPPGTLARMTARLASTSGLIGIRGVIADLIGTTAMLCRDLPGAIRVAGIEAILADQTEAAGGLVARHLDLPQVSVANALLINREPLLPPAFVNWRYDESDWGLTRNRGGYRIADLLMRPLTSRIRLQAAAWGLGPIATLEDCLSPMLQVSQSVESFDFPRRQAPAGLVHVGPLREPETRPFEPRDPGPLVFCSLGTLQGARVSIFRTVARACAGLDLSLVIAHGGKLRPVEASRLQGSAQVEAFVPQRSVMTRAVAVVTHGGLNTVLDALAAGVPMVVVPIAFEQGAIAARIERCGAGLAIPPGRLTVRRLGDALTRLRTDPAFRRNALALRDDIGRAGGVARAVALIEAAVSPAHGTLAAVGSSQPR